MGRYVVFALLLSGCACEPIDIDASGCAAPFETPPPDLSVPRDLSRPVRDLPPVDDLSLDDGGFDDGGLDGG